MVDEPIKPTRFIINLENNGGLFLLGTETPGEYWKDVKDSLNGAIFRPYYNGLLDFENLDLLIRERKWNCYHHFKSILSLHPSLAEKASPNPEDSFLDFFREKQKELLGYSKEAELRFVDDVTKDLQNRGHNSIYMKDLLGYEE